MVIPSRADLVLVGLMGLAVAHLAVLGWWVVDDAAISFAYARSLAEGYGLTPYFGGEQVEGYSNPTWVVLLAMGQVASVDPFVTAKAASYALVAATVPLVHALGRRVDRDAGLPAAALFALNTQVAVFGAAGLENPLLWFLLALGLLWASHEIERGSVPWSAVVFAVLGASRPEGLVYAAAVVPWVGVGAVREGRGWRPIAQWLALLLLPTAAYQLGRFWWFGYPFPMTYYAKVHTGPEALAQWQGIGWRYVRGFAQDLGRVWTLPVFLVGAFGPRWRLVAGVVAAVAVLALLPSLARFFGPPAAVGLLGLAVLLVVPISRTEPGLVRGMCWTVALAAAVFAIRAGGDWMSGHRWFAITAVPGAVLGGLGLTELAKLAPKPVGAAATVLAVALFGIVNVAATFGYRIDPETSAFMVGARVKTAKELVERLEIDDRPVYMTFDIGGFLWWSGMEVVDSMGLVNVPVAMNKRYGTAFWNEYLAERRPHVLLRVGARPGSGEEGQVVVDQYVHLGRGTRVRRDLLFEPAWTGSTDPPVAFEGGVEVAGLEVSAPVAAGEPVQVALGVRSTAGTSFTAELVLGDDGGNLLARWPVDLAHGMLATPLWRPDEVFHGRYAIGLPAGLDLGSYPLGLRLTAGDRVLVPSEGATVATDGVVWLGDRVEVVSTLAAGAFAAAARERALELARSGRCEAADQARIRDPEALRVRAECWIGRRDGDRIAALERARRLDPSAPGLAEQAGSLADERYADGLGARDEGDVDRAYRAFADVMRLDPSRSRARRYAEEARSERLARAWRSE